MTKTKPENKQKGKIRSFAVSGFSDSHIRFLEITTSPETKMPRENLKDKLDGNELDLSLNNLSVVPVSELVCLYTLIRNENGSFKIKPVITDQLMQMIFFC